MIRLINRNTENDLNIPKEIFQGLIKSNAFTFIHEEENLIGSNINLQNLAAVEKASITKPYFIMFLAQSICSSFFTLAELKHTQVFIKEVTFLTGLNLDLDYEVVFSVSKVNPTEHLAFVDFFVLVANTGELTIMGKAFFLNKEKI